MADFETLLDLQAHDTELDQLRHRIEHHELRGVIAGLDAEVVVLDGEVAEPEARRHELRRELKRLEDEAVTFQEKAARENDRLYDGTVTSPKELQAIQHEIETLKAHQAQLEDRELELMEELEPLDAELAGADARRAALAERRAGASDELTVAVAELESRIAEVQAERDTLAGRVPDTLLTTYAALRRRLGGVAAARLNGSRCEGCHLALPPGELEEVRRVPADQVAHCPECGRILVR